MKKMTIIGDIMVEPDFLNAAKQADGSYDFHPSFAPLKPMFDKADYNVGNLETPLAGEALGYCTRIVSFNAPDCLGQALKDTGIDFVTTANNHALDRGYQGLQNTIDALDRIGLKHTGTFKTPEDRQISYVTLGDTKIAVLSYGHSTNFGINGETCPDGCFNYLLPNEAKREIHPAPDPKFLAVKKLVGELLGRKVLWEEGVQLKRAMGLFVGNYDFDCDPAEAEKSWKQVEQDYAEARKNADLVLFFPHSGGQFNVEPAGFSLEVMRRAVALGFDGVYAAHSHTTQKGFWQDGKAFFYSLGNVTMSPNTYYSEAPTLPNYGLAVHLYIENKKIQKVTFSLIKMVEPVGGLLKVHPVYDLAKTLQGEELETLRRETLEVCKRICGKDFTDIQEEYDF